MVVVCTRNTYSTPPAAHPLLSRCMTTMQTHRIDAEFKQDPKSWCEKIRPTGCWSHENEREKKADGVDKNVRGLTNTGSHFITIRGEMYSVLYLDAHANHYHMCRFFILCHPRAWSERPNRKRGSRVRHRSGGENTAPTLRPLTVRLGLDSQSR